MRKSVISNNRNAIGPLPMIPEKEFLQQMIAHLSSSQEVRVQRVAQAMKDRLHKLP